MEPQCDRCKEFYDQGAHYCGCCGYRFPHVKGQIPIFDKLMIALSAFACLFIAGELLILLLKSPAVFSIAGDFGIGIQVIIPTPTRIATLTGIGSEIWWIMLVCALTAAVCYGIWRYLKAAKISKAEGEPENLMKTGLFWVAILFSANLALEVVLMYIAMACGLTIDSSWMNDYTHEELLLMLAHASFWEEIITRVIFIGIPMFVIQIIRTKKLNAAKYLVGGFGMSKAAVVLIVFSGIMFGLAHDSGWGMTKAAITCIGGIVMGYVFVRFGLYASILMHFMTDYLSSFMYSGFGLSFISIIGMRVFLIMGFVAIAFIIKRIPKGKNALINIFKGYPVFNDKLSE